MEIFTRKTALALFIALFATSTYAKDFSYIETFDDDATFSAGGSLPDGWLGDNSVTPVQRYEGSYLGSGNHSGSYVLGTLASSSMGRDSWVYTKKMSLKGGVTYTISYWLHMPGGVAPAAYNNNVALYVGNDQTREAATTKLGETGNTVFSEWTQQTYQFTPTADGDYAFAVNITSQLYNSGYVALDDFEVSGDEPGGSTVDPDDPDKVMCELPYSQSFDNENKDYDGTTYVPKGWLATGSSTFVTASTDELKAADGTYYLIAPESKVKRDDRIYTPFFHMKAGEEYTASFYLYMPGNSGYQRASDFSFTVGDEQDSEFQKPLLTLTDYTNETWTKQTVTYSPDEDGDYCFSFVLGGENAYAGEVCLDLFTLTTPEAKAKPKANFSFNGHFDLMNSKLIVIDGSKVQMVNQSSDSDSYLWEVPGAVPETSTEANPVFSFPEDGDYNVKLTATNERGESSTTEKVSVEVISESSQLPVGVYNPNEDELWTRSKVPAYDTNPSCDWVTGVNHYYNHFAERFNLPEGRKYGVSSLTLYLCYYNIASRYYSDQADEPVSIVLYGEKDGKPDTDNEFGRYTSTMKGLFGTLGLSEAEMRSIPFDKPIVADGPFYVAFEFSDNLWIDEPDANLSRTAVGFGGFTHRSKLTTLYVQPTAVPATSSFVPDGSYCPVDSVDAQYKGLGLNLVAWTSVEGTETAVALTTDGSVAFDARLSGDRLTVSGTHAGETVLVSDASGKTVAIAKAADKSTSLHLANVPSGIYIVKTAQGVRKIVKR